MQGIAFLFLVAVSSAAAVTDYNAQLIKYLQNNITDYSPLLLPRINTSAELEIQMDAMLSHIVSVEPAKQSIKISAYIEAKWMEERLIWNPDDFGGVRLIRWDAKKIWFPTIIIYNGIGDQQYLDNILPIRLEHHNNTKLTAVVSQWRREFEFFCHFSMTKFPFDNHTCELLFFFNDQGFTSVKPVKNPYFGFNETAIFNEGTEWELISATTYDTVKYYQVIANRDKTPLRTYVLKLSIRRHSMYYIINLIIPLLLLTLLQLLVYFVPLESGEKLGFGITIMLSFTVFLLLLDGILPKSQFMPAIAFFIVAAMTLSSVSLLLTSLIMWLHFINDGDRKLSPCARAVFVRFLGRLFCVSGATGTAAVADIPAREHPDQKQGAGSSDNLKTEPSKSEFVLAVRAVERLVGLIGTVATFIIIFVFILRPFQLME